MILKYIHVKSATHPINKSWWLIARGHIFPRENFKEMEQDTWVWVYILI